jgi:hypothetical protein
MNDGGDVAGALLVGARFDSAF